ncbi:MAG TPA: DUF6152 family protein [Gammaproteobacteria bacterium]|nr:DUF6152 family protein [Gammaproteobacteria bacterium]
MPRATLGERIAMLDPLTSAALEAGKPTLRLAGVAGRGSPLTARIAASALALAVPCIAHAHHSVGVFYDAASSSELTGTITEIAWVNPHIRFTLESVDVGGAPVVWAIESGSVNMLERNGIRRDQLAVGSEVVVVGRPSRLGRQAVYATSIRTPEGGTVALQGSFGESEAASAGRLASPQPTAGSGRDAFFRVWTKGRAYGDPANDSPTGLALPYTPAALAAQARFDPLTDDTALACIPQGMPGIMDNPFPIELVARDGNILLRAEEWDIERTIHLTDAADPAAQPATPLGYSVGRWDGETLVVETTRIDWPYFDDTGTPQSAAVETLERFSLSAGGARLDYTITVTDPETFIEPVTLDGYWVWVPGERIKPYNCTR